MSLNLIASQNLKVDMHFMHLLVSTSVRLVLGPPVGPFAYMRVTKGRPSSAASSPLGSSTTPVTITHQSNSEYKYSPWM